MEKGFIKLIINTICIYAIILCVLSRKLIMESDDLLTYNTPGPTKITPPANRYLQNNHLSLSCYQNIFTHQIVRQMALPYRSKTETQHPCK